MHEMVVKETLKKWEEMVEEQKQQQEHKQSTTKKDNTLWQHERQ